jgi:hypothetical protein
MPDHLWAPTTSLRPIGALTHYSEPSGPLSPEEGLHHRSREVRYIGAGETGVLEGSRSAACATTARSSEMGRRLLPSYEALAGKTIQRWRGSTALAWLVYAKIDLVSLILCGRAMLEQPSSFSDSLSISATKLTQCGDASAECAASCSRPRH